MKGPSQATDPARRQVMLNLLESVEKDGKGSQRDRASEFGVALGLVNAYLNYCIRKGLIRVKKIPSRRYAYYLTPKGFSEKSRLAVSLVSSSFHTFRQARSQYSEALQRFQKLGVSRVVLVGVSELAEVAVLSAAESDIAVAAIIDPNATTERYLGVPVTRFWQSAPGSFGGALITDLADPAASRMAAIAVLGENRVAVPAILGVTRERQPT